MNREQAEVVGLKVLGWLVNDEDLVGQFLGQSGVLASELGGRAQDAEFLGFILDFLLTDDAAVQAFSEDNSLPGDTISRARMALPGGVVPNWT